MARYFDFSEDVSRCPRAQRGLLIFPKYTQNFIWLGKKVRNVFRAFFVLRKETIGVEDSDTAVRKAGGLSHDYEWAEQNCGGAVSWSLPFRELEEEGRKILRPCPDKKRGHELLHGLESTLWMMLSWRACRQRGPQRAFQQELREPWQRERQVLGCPPDGRQEWWIPALCGSWTRSCSSRT